MPRRLSVTRAATTGSLLLSQVPRPDKLPAGTCSLVRALCACVRPVGIQIGYDDLMGLTGIAFDLPAPADFAAPSAHPLRCEGVVEGLCALGLKARCVSLEPQDPAAVVAVVEEGLESGFAVPVLGWPAAGDDWAVITGSDRGRGVLCGWPSRPATEAYLGAPPRGEAAIVLLERRQPPSPTQALLEALGRAADRAGRVAETYAQWVSCLRAQAGWGEDAGACILRHEAFCDALADARTSAAAFCERAGETLGPEAGEWLTQAAAEAYAIVSELEARDPPIGDPEVLQAFESAQWREEWAATVQLLSRAEARLLGCLRSACRGDLPPDPDW